MTTYNSTPSVEQLLYTNVDRVVDGQELSGWQTMATTPGMDEAEADWLRSLIDPGLSGTRPLPGYPTPEQVAAADRRLRQVPSSSGTVLVHTAPAGTDSTGRTNSMTHVLLLPRQAAPSLRTTDLWRSPGWVTPFGAQAVRDAVLPPPQDLVPGEVTTMDAVTEFVLQEGRGAVLTALADALEPVLASRVPGPPRPAPDTTVLLGVRSTDEAALWVAALQRCCAPLTGCYLGFSTLETAGTMTEVDAVMASPTDLACVPLAELEAVEARPGLVVINPDSPPTSAPQGTWGKLVAAMTSSMARWVTGQEGLETVLSLLEDHRELTPAWPLAMAEASEPGLFSDVINVTADVDRELMTCQPAALAQNPYLTGLLTERFLDSSDTDPASWYAKLDAVPLGTPVGGVVSGLVNKYLDSAVADSGWLLDDTRQASATVTYWLRSWTTEPEPGRDMRLRLLVRTAERTVGDTPITHLLLADRLTRDGVVLGEADTTRLVIDSAQSLVGPGNPLLRGQVLGLSPAPDLMDAIRVLVEDLLVVPVEDVPVLPRLDRQVAAWLAADGPRTLGPALGAEVALAFLVGAPGTDVETVLAFLGALSRRFHLDPTVVDSLVAVCTPRQALAMTPLCADRVVLVSRVLARDPQGEGAQEAAKWLMRVKQHSLEQLSVTPLEAMSQGTAAALLTLSRQVPLASGLETSVACCLAGNILVALQSLLTSQGMWAPQAVAGRPAWPAPGGGAPSDAPQPEVVQPEAVPDAAPPTPEGVQDPAPQDGAPGPDPYGVWGPDPWTQAPPARQDIRYPGDPPRPPAPPSPESVRLTPYQQDVCDRALAVLLLVLWNDQAVRLEGLRPEMTVLAQERLGLLAGRLEETNAFLVDGEEVDSVLVAGAVVRLYWLMSGSRHQDQQAEREALTEVETASHHLLHSQDELVLALCRAWVCGFDEDSGNRFVATVLSGLPGDPDAEKWVRKHIMPASGLRKKLSGRFFGGR